MHLREINRTTALLLEHQGRPPFQTLQPEPEVWLDNQEVMQQLHWSKSTLQRRRIDGTLPYTKIKGKYYYREADISKMMRSDF